jgi:hypothetical protein
MPERADVPKTDRELLLQVAGDVKSLNEKLDGENGLCALLQRHDARLTAIENWRWGLAGAFGLLALLIGWGWFRIV